MKFELARFLPYFSLSFAKITVYISKDLIEFRSNFKLNFLRFLLQKRIKINPVHQICEKYIL